MSISNQHNFAGNVVAALATACWLGWVTSGAAEPSLRETFQSQLLVGVARDGWRPGDYQTNELALIRRQFTALTPANCMKLQLGQPAGGRFNFSVADALVAFAIASDLKVCGHTLIWAEDERTPPWLFQDGTNAADHELFCQQLKPHIDTVAGRYRSKVITWDVVNETLDDGTNFTRPSTWLSIGGEEFIAKAFEFTHTTDPQARLILNACSVEHPLKREKLLPRLRSRKTANAPVHAVGIRGDYELDAVPYKHNEATIQTLHDLGLKVVITKSNIDAIPRTRWWAEGDKHRDESAKFNACTNGCPADVFQRQAGQYGKRMWMTGVSYFERNDASIKDGLKWAQLIHNHLTVSDMNGWFYWWGACYKTKGESLITLDLKACLKTPTQCRVRARGLQDSACFPDRCRPGALTGRVFKQALKSRTYATTKRLFAFGNFSRFVRPGHVRLGCAPSPAPGASVTAFRGADKGPLVVVAINSGEAAQDIEYRLEGRQVKSFTPYRTSALESLARLGDVKLNQGTLKVSLSAQSVTSFVASEVKSIPSAR